MSTFAPLGVFDISSGEAISRLAQLLQRSVVASEAAGPAGVFASLDIFMEELDFAADAARNGYESSADFARDQENAKAAWSEFLEQHPELGPLVVGEDDLLAAVATMPAGEWFRSADVARVFRDPPAHDDIVRVGLALRKLAARKFVEAAYVGDGPHNRSRRTRVWRRR